MRKLPLRTLLLVFVCIVIFLAGAWAMTDSPAENQSENTYQSQKCEYSEKHDASPKRKMVNSVILSCLQTAKPSQEKQENQRENDIVESIRGYLHKFVPDATSLLTYILAISTLLLWIDTRRLAEGGRTQERILQESLDVDIQSTRPWIKIDFKNIGKIYLRQNGSESEFAGIYVEFITKNVGNTPAVDYFLKTAVVNLNDLPEIDAIFKRFITEPLPVVNDVIFPVDSPTNQTHGLWVPKSFFSMEKKDFLGVLAVAVYRIPGSKEVKYTPMRIKVRIPYVLSGESVNFLVTENHMSTDISPGRNVNLQLK